MRKIIPVFFIVISGFAAFFYFKNIDLDKNAVNDGNNVKMEANNSLREDYRQSASDIFNEYIDNMDDLENVAAQKNRLLELKVPTELKALHLDLILMMTKTESYIRSGEGIDVSASEKAIKEAKEKYPWLNQ